MPFPARPLRRVAPALLVLALAHGALHAAAQERAPLPSPSALASPEALDHASSEPAAEGGSSSGDVQGTFRIDESVVTGTKTPHAAKDAPIPTEVITREQVEETATTNITEVLNQVPDIYVQRNQEFGLGASVVRMQGADPNKVAILLDGQRFRGGVDGVVDLRDIPLGSIDQIEIIRGPASSLYGSDAMAGVINIRTRTGSDTPTVDLTAGAGTFSEQVYSLSHGWHVGPVRYQISAQHDEVAIAKLLGPISAQFEGDDVNDTQKRDSIFGKIEIPIDTHTIRVSADYLKERNPLSDSDDLQNLIGWTWLPAPNWTVDVVASRYGFDRKNDLPGFVEDITYADWTPEARASWQTKGPWDTRHLVTGGTRVQIETLESPGRAIGSGDDVVVAPPVDADATQVSPFLQDEIFYGDRISLVLGLSLDDHSGYGVQFNPRATATYRWSDALRLSFTVGRGFRAPDLLQLYDIDINNVVQVGNRVTGYAIVGNPNLKPETDVAFNLQADFSIGQALQGTITAFHHDFDDLIANVIACPTPTMCNPGFTNPFPDLQGPIFTFDNVDKALTEGVDLGLRFYPLDYAPAGWAGANSLEVSLGYGFLHTENKSGIQNEDGKNLPFRPDNRVIPAIQWAHSRYGTTARIWGEFQSELFTDLANTPEGRVGPHWFWNFKVTQNVPSLVDLLTESPAWLDGVSIFAQGLNVFDEVVEAAAIAAQSRQLTARATFLGGVTYRFR